MTYFHQFHNNFKRQYFLIYGGSWPWFLDHLGSWVLKGPGSSRVLSPEGSWVLKGPESSMVLGPYFPVFPFIKCEQIFRTLQICFYLLKKSKTAKKICVCVQCSDDILPVITNNLLDLKVALSAAGSFL